VSFRVRFARQAEDDLIRLYEFILERDAPDWPVVERALGAIRNAVPGLARTPFSYRKAAESPFLRELVIPFSASGYVALFEIEDERTVTVLAVRHQREDDYY